MTDKSIGVLREMAKRGRKYRERRTIEIFGGEAEFELRPLVDEEFLPISARMADLLGIEEETIRGGDTVEEAMSKIDEVRDEEDMSIDVGALDKDFVRIIQEAAWRALTADFDEEGNRHEFDNGNTDDIDNNEEAEEFIKNLVGGFSLEIGYESLDLAGNIRDAEKFRGSRGSL